jgi:hypothetical protein
MYAQSIHVRAAPRRAVSASGAAERVRHWSIATEQRQHHLPSTGARADAVATSQHDAFSTSANVAILPDDCVE